MKTEPEKTNDELGKIIFGENVPFEKRKNALRTFLKKVRLDKNRSNICIETSTKIWNNPAVPVAEKSPLNAFLIKKIEDPDGKD